MTTALFIVTLGVCPWTAYGRPPKEKPAPPPTILPAEPAWTITLPAPPAAGGAMDRDFIYVPLQGDQLVALDRQSGDIAWQRDGKSDWPLVAADGVLYAAADTRIQALNPADGEPMWTVSLERPVMGPLRVQGSLVIALMTPDDVYAFRTSDGAMIWRHSLGGTGGATQMTADADGVYVTAPGGRVIELSLADGKPRWETMIPGMPSAPAAVHDRVFVGSTDNFFYAFDARSGHLAWKWRSGGDVIGAATDLHAVYFASLDNILRSVNRGNGNQRWQKDTGTRPVAPPVVVGPVVVVPGVGASLLAFSVLTGAPVGAFTPPGSAEFKGDPLLDPELRPFEVAAVVITRDGRVIGLRPTGMLFREQPPAPFQQLPGRRLTREPPPFTASEESAAPEPR